MLRLRPRRRPAGDLEAALSAANGEIDAKRLPKAIEAMLSNYRGAKVEIPEADAKGVLLRLAQAAEAEGHIRRAPSRRRRSIGSSRWC